MVEVAERFFIEGGWSGPFENGEIANAGTVFGSGGRVGDGAVTFVSSLATTDYLYYRRCEGGVLVANSLPLLLAWTRDRLDPHCDQYARINASIVDGVDEYIRSLPTMEATVTRLMHRNLVVDRQSVLEVDKPSPPRFESYEAYARYLDDEYRATCGQHEGRRPRNSTSLLLDAVPRIRFDGRQRRRCPVRNRCGLHRDPRQGQGTFRDDRPQVRSQ
jgi:hypothetical protein